MSVLAHDPARRSGARNPVFQEIPSAVQGERFLMVRNQTPRLLWALVGALAVFCVFLEVQVLELRRDLRNADLMREAYNYNIARALAKVGVDYDAAAIGAEAKED